MLNQYLHKSLTAVLTSLLMFTMLLTPSAQAETVSKLDLKKYGTPEPLLKPITSAIGIYDGAVGKEDGHDVMFTTTKGSPAYFNVVDLDNYKLLRSFPLEGEGYSWHHEVAPDGSVYVAGSDKLWKYSPVTKQIEAVADFGSEGPWSLVTDEAGNAYVGTYPGGKVFKYDSQTRKITDYGKMIGAIAQEYVRSLAYHDGVIYAGTAHDKLIRLNLATGEKSEIASVLKDTGFVYGLNVVDNRYLFAWYSVSRKMYVYDIQTGTWLEPVMTNVAGLHVTNSLDGEVYFVADNKLKAFNLNTHTVRDTPMTYGSGLRGADWAVLENDPDLPGISLVTIQFGGSVSFLNIQTGKVKVYPPVVDVSPNALHEVETGPDGRIYMSTLGAAAGAIYDPSTGNNVPITLGQADIMAPFDTKMYMGVYSGAVLYEYDTLQTPGAQNPKRTFKIGEEQDRIVSMTSGDGKLFMGSVSTYGKLGGAVTVYDPKAPDAAKVYRNIVLNQSVVGLAYKNGKLFGSTNINNGLGSQPTESEAKMFVLDVATGVKTAEFSLDIPGVTKPKFIGGLSVGPDGLIWGAVNGYVFALDPDTLKVVKSKQVFFGNPSFGVWSLVQVAWSDGIFYTLFGTELVAVDPESLEYRNVTKAFNFSFGKDGHLYYSAHEDKTLLKRMTVTNLREPIPSSVNNSSFELPVANGAIPGWTSLYASVTGAAYGISEEQSYGGRSSLKLTDGSDTAAVGLQSDKINVVKKENYTAKARFYLEKGTASLLIRFYNNGNHLKEEREVVVLGEPGKWQEVEVSLTAPASAEYAQIEVSTGDSGLSTVYIDDVELIGKLPAAGSEEQD